MKPIKYLISQVLLIGMVMSLMSCAITRERPRDNGKHLGWYKNNNHKETKVYILKKDKPNQSKNKDHWNAKK
jgi:hypothetical protein